MAPPVASPAPITTQTLSLAMAGLPAVQSVGGTEIAQGRLSHATVRGAGCADAAGTRPARRRISAVVSPSPSGRQPGGANRYTQTSRGERAERRSFKRPIQGSKLMTRILRDDLGCEISP